jgi:hypothetical protein
MVRFDNSRARLARVALSVGTRRDDDGDGDGSSD